MFRRTGPSATAIGRVRAQRLAFRPRAKVSLRSLLATALLSLGLFTLNSNIGAAYASNPPPTVSTVIPSAGPGTGGTSVTIRGANFTEATRVTFGSTEATSFTVRSASSIKAVSPAGTGTVDVTVTTPGGTSATGVADHFTYLPTVTAVAPNSGPVDGATTVTITGVDFNGATAVTFGSTEASSFTVNSATSITAVSPAETEPTKVHVTVTTPEGTSLRSSKDIFKFTPTVTQVSPNTGPPAGGTPVSVNGSGFAVGQTATKISFGGVQAVSVNCTTTTECSATTPELRRGVQYIGTVDVVATVNTLKSPKAPADQFDYHGLYLRGERGRLPVGTRLTLREELSAARFNQCFAYLAAQVTTNGETTDEISARGVEHYTNCLPYEWFGVLPDAFTLHIHSDGTADIEGAMGVGKNTGGCVYEGDKMSGGFEIDAPLSVTLAGTFTFVEEEQPGEGCSETETVEMSLTGNIGEQLEVELVQ